MKVTGYHRNAIIAARRATILLAEAEREIARLRREAKS